MVVESPSALGVEVLCGRFADIMQERRPAQVYIVRSGSNAVKHSHRMIEIIFMRPAFDYLNPLHPCQFGHYDGEQSAAEQVIPPYRGLRSRHNLEQLILDTLGGDNLDSRSIAAQGCESHRVDVEIELGGETDTAQHAQRVVGESDVRVERRADNTALDVAEAVVAVDYLAEVIFIDRNRHGIDGEIAPREIIVKCAVFNDGITRITVIRLPACTYKLEFYLAPVHLRRTVVAVYGQRGLRAERLGHRPGKVDTRPHRNEVDILGVTAYNEVAYITAHDIALTPHGVGHIPYCMEYL